MSLVFVALVETVALVSVDFATALWFFSSIFLCSRFTSSLNSSWKKFAIIPMKIPMMKTIFCSKCHNTPYTWYLHQVQPYQLILELHRHNHRAKPRPVYCSLNQTSALCLMIGSQTAKPFQPFLDLSTNGHTVCLDGRLTKRMAELRVKCPWWWASHIPRNPYRAARRIYVANPLRRKQCPVWRFRYIWCTSARCPWIFLPSPIPYCTPVDSPGNDLYGMCRVPQPISHRGCQRCIPTCQCSENNAAGVVLSHAATERSNERESVWTTRDKAL